MSRVPRFSKGLEDFVIIQRDDYKVLEFPSESGKCLPQVFGESFANVAWWTFRWSIPEFLSMVISPGNFRLHAIAPSVHSKVLRRRGDMALLDQLIYRIYHLYRLTRALTNAKQFSRYTLTDNSQYQDWQNMWSSSGCSHNQTGPTQNPTSTHSGVGATLSNVGGYHPPGFVTFTRLVVAARTWVGKRWRHVGRWFFLGSLWVRPRT